MPGAGVNAGIMHWLSKAMAKITALAEAVRIHDMQLNIPGEVEDHPDAILEILQGNRTAVQFG